MSSQPSPPHPHPVPKRAPEPDELKVVQHSQLFYWWPVWAMGFILFLITYFGGQHLVVLPGNATIHPGSDNKAYTIQVNDAPPEGATDGTLVKSVFPLEVSKLKYLGVLWAVVLILVILITNVPLRGLWAVVVIVTIVMLLIIITAFGVWDPIIRALYFLDIRINAAGYFVLSAALFIIWAVTVFLFDQQIYIVFMPGMMKVRDTIGGGETAYDTSGMMVEHLRDDPFRHWILGLGSGDLVVHPSGPQSREIRLNNVLFVGRKMQRIEQFKTEKPVVAGG